MASVFGGLRALVLLVLLLVVFSSAAACKSPVRGAGPLYSSAGTDPKLKATLIKLVRTKADYSSTINEVVNYVIDVGYGYTVQIRTMDLPEMQQALTAGDVHLVLDARQPQNMEWFDGAVASGAILDLGPTYETDSHAFNGGAHPSLQEINPEMVQVLTKMKMQLRRIQEAQSWHSDNNIEGSKRLAVYYLWNFDWDDGWITWMPYNPAENLRQQMFFYTGLRAGDVYRGIEYEIPGFEDYRKEAEE